MKKKARIRELREQSAIAKKNIYRNKEEERKAVIKAQEEERKAAAEAERRKELEKGRIPVRERKLSEENKSSAKAAGLKSTFVLSSNKNEYELLMTTFGKGNQAISEKRINNGSVQNISEHPVLTVTPVEEKQFRIDGRVKDAWTDNPLYTVSEPRPHMREDLIHAKAKLEERYFGQTFEDNIHIQAIYNILDIEKILTIHVNNIVFTINNFLREEGEDLADIVAYITKYKDLSKFEEKDREYYELFCKLCDAKQLGYLNLEILSEENNRPGKKQDLNTIKLSRTDFFNMLSALGTMRQMLAHGEPKQNIYHFESKKEISKLLDSLYSKRVKELNDGFLEKAGKNLVLLFRAYDVKSPAAKAEYVRAYYDFTVRKQYKNQGFSVKLLREHMTADIEEAFVLRDQQYDSVRGKLNPFVDFAIFRYYQEHTGEIEKLVGDLRSSFNDAEKDQIYAREAERVWPLLKSLILDHILPNMKGEVIKNISADEDVNPDMIRDIKISTDGTALSKFVYMLTLFINGKEINDLLTTLIHKFENIDSFLSVMKAEDLFVGFEEAFKLFEKSGQIAEELRAINSFARMSEPSANARKIMYIEALYVLGIEEKNLEKEVEEILDPETKTRDPQKRGLRNFIANNVIESERFKYLVRYGNVRKLKGIANNRKVIKFVLKDIPNAQIVRYYNSIKGCSDDFYPEMRDKLTEELTGFSFKDISDVEQNDRRATLQQQEEKRCKQALVRLYLTALYLVLKNLVYINSRYFLAFHCVERDRMLVFPEMKDEWKAKGFKEFSRMFLEEYPQKSRVQKYLNQNFENSDECVIKIFRDKVEHLDTVRNADLYLEDIRSFDSWFDLYHYVMQRRIKAQCDYNRITEGRKKDELIPKTLYYFSLVEKYHTYCKDMLKALCVPFAYNLPRYKNLTIEGLFDMNHPGKREDTKNKAMGAALE